MEGGASGRPDRIGSDERMLPGRRPLPPGLVRVYNPTTKAWEVRSTSSRDDPREPVPAGMVRVYRPGTGYQLIPEREVRKMPRPKKVEGPDLRPAWSVSATIELPEIPDTMTATVHGDDLSDAASSAKRAFISAFGTAATIRIMAVERKPEADVTAEDETPATVDDVSTDNGAAPEAETPREPVKTGRR